MSWYDVETAVVKVVQAIHPTLKVIKGYSNGPEPVTAYAWVDLLSLDPAGREQGSSLSVEGVVQTTEHYIGRCRITFVGKDVTGNHGGDLAAAFSESLPKPSILEVMETQKLSLMSKGTVKRVPKMRETQWYNSYVVEIVIGYQVTTTEDNDGITTVVLDGEFVAGSDTITQEITISE